MKLRSSMKIYWRMGGISTRRSRFLVLLLPCLVFFCCFCVGISYAQNSQLTAGQILRDYEQLVSPNGRNQLLFFSPAGTSKRYLGIQHNSWSTLIPTAGYLWVANRENPLYDTSGVLNITQEGNMVLSDSRGPIITVNSNQPAAAAANSNTTGSRSSNRSSVTTTLLSLHDSGNLILKAGDKIVWQSFDYPSHTLLPGMKLGIFGLKTGSPPQKKFLTSWLTPMVAAAGAFTLGINPNNTRELVIWRRDVLYRRIGIWNGSIFTNIPYYYYYYFNFSYHSNENESYYTISRLHPDDEPYSSDNSVWMTMNPTGSFDMYTLPYNYLVSIETCDDKRGKFYQGCAKPEPSNCKMGDDFSQKSGKYYIIEGQFSDYQYVNMSISDCKEICKKNCSCTSYTSASDDGTGCTFPSARETSIFTNGTYYIRNKDRPRKKRLLSWLIISGPVVVSLLVLSLLLRHLGMTRKKRSTSQGDTELIMNELNASMTKVDKLSGAHKVDLRGKKDHHELPIFKFSTIQVATDHFSDANKLGQGGFGPVYKGKLVDGQEIAVKRLAKRSGQGLEEFKNEVMLISKLQHRNLVRVLGCCIQGEERILIYEYLPNKSLDYFLFDATKRALLDWKKRLSIIEGIAQGLLYLHMYSRFKIIHRDLKTSNILLDSNMNPKISDFGTARIFGEDESLANTNRIVGTRGYMSPEYAMDGIFSEKSDVFSFGVMMLEIVCGMKNSGFYESDRHLNLLDYAWDLWKEGRCMELMNRELLDEICSTDDVMRYIQVGLLCVQESAADRPTMSDVLPMLSNKLMSLPTPKQPAFSAISGIDDHNADLPQNPTPCSINDVSLSELVAR